MLGSGTWSSVFGPLRNLTLRIQEQNLPSHIISLTAHFAPLCGPHESAQDEPLCVRPSFQEHCEIQSFFLAGVYKFQLFTGSGYKAQHFSLFRFFLFHGNSFSVSNNLLLLIIYITYINIHRH